MRRAAIAVAAAALLAAADVTPPFGRFHPTLIDQVRAIPLTGGRPAGVAVDPAGTTAALVTTGGRLMLVDLEKGQLRRNDRLAEAAALAFGREDLLAVGLKGQVELVSGRELDQKKTVAIAGAGPIAALAFSASGRYLAAADAAGVWVVDAAAGTVGPRHEHGGPPALAAALAFDEAERRLTVATAAGTVMALEAAGGRVLHPKARAAGLAEGASIGRPAVDGAGGRAAFEVVETRQVEGTELQSRRVVVVEPARGVVLSTDLVPVLPLEGLAFAAEGAFLVGHTREELWIWKAEGRLSLQRVLSVPSGTLQTAAVAGRADRIVTAGTGDTGAMVARLFGVRTETAPRPGYLGVRFKGTSTEVERVVIDSPASRTPIGMALDQVDVVLSIGGKPVATAAEAQAAVRSFKEGDEVEVEFIRGRERSRVKVRLGGLIE
jgi:hypothetical protein